MGLRKGRAGASGLSPAEERAARAERIVVVEADPYGWIAVSESGAEYYHLYLEPHARRLVCTCGDFIYRGNAEPGFECKHISAVLKFIARCYLATEYSPSSRRPRVA
jgi:hypothetical protein